MCVTYHCRDGPRPLDNPFAVAVEQWEHPADPEIWKRMLNARHFDDVRVELLANEAGVALVRRPQLRQVAALT